MTGNEAWVQAWFAKGEKDLRLGEIALAKDPDLADASCFHAQQCAEKCLKGFLIHSGRSLDKTHDLVKVLTACTKVDSEFTQWLDPCRILSAYAVEPRYPDDFVEYTREDAAEALDLARQIRDFVLARISSSPSAA